MLERTRGRPLGITIIAIILAVEGILGIIGGIVALGASAGLGIFTLILGILYLVLAWGLWTLQPWAFWATVVLEVVALINGILAFVGGSAGHGIVAIVIALIVLIYLFADRNVRAAFRT
jgi:uncharacterized membrane protein (DUF2068 family)